jgi:hypothetical protein
MMLHTYHNIGVQLALEARRRLLAATIPFLFAVLPLTVSAQQASPSPTPDNTTGLDLEIENPLTKLLRLPFQYNFNFNYGYARLMQQQIKFQPLVPISLGDGHVLIARIIVPFDITPPRVQGETEAIGFGDFNPQLYYIARQGPVLFGYGPTFLIPAATNTRLGSGKWGAGPDVGISVQTSRALFYMLVNNLWSFAGVASREPYNRGSYQPSASWPVSNGYSIGVQSNTTVNWNAPGNRKWTVPIGPTWSKVFPVSRGKIQLGGGFFWNTVHPPTGSTWTARLTLTFLSPAATR